MKRKIVIPYAGLLILVVVLLVLNRAVKEKQKTDISVTSNSEITKSPATRSAALNQLEDTSVLGGRAGYFRWRKDVEAVKQGQEFNLDIMLINTSQLDQTKDEGISAAEVELTFDPTQLQAIDLDPKKEGIQIQPGKIFTSFLANQVDQIKGTIYISAFSMPGGTIFNSNDKTEDEMVFATIRFKKLNPDNEPIKMTINGDNDTADKTNIYTNIKGLTDYDLWNQGISSQGWEW